MKSFLQSFAGTLAAILLLLLTAAGIGSCVTDDTPDVRKHSWLVIELYGDLLEYDPPGGPLSAVSSSSKIAARVPAKDCRKDFMTSPPPAF